MNEHLRLAIDHLHEGVQVISHDWRYLYLNETAAIHGRRSTADLLGERMQDCYPGIEQTPLFAVLERVMTTRRAERMRNEFEYDGGDRGWFDLRVEPVPAGICVLSVDVTDDQQRQDRLIAVESQLVHAQKMEALGRLAGGVAHDFNNQLTAILGFTQMLLEQRPGAEMESDLREIEAAADRSAALIRQLLAFGKRQVLRLEPVDLPALVRNVTRLLDRVLGGQVRCELRIDSATQSILADAGQLEHVLTNLAVNARDAMSAGGRLTISTTTVEVTANQARAHASMTPGWYSVLAVADTGQGMDEQTKARIFEPFFTTKQAGQGTGLGLAMVYGIVKQMNGFIWVDSEPGRGTTFRLYFPVNGERVSENAPAQVKTAIDADGAHTRSARTILVVEDDRGVREFVARSLSQHGYGVRVAESADEAWDILREESGVDLLLLDVVLPGERHSALKDHLERTGLPVMFMSGYSEPHVKRQPFEPAAPLLEKPFTVDQLFTAVRDVLRGSAPKPATTSTVAPKVASHGDHTPVGPTNAEV